MLQTNTKYTMSLILTWLLYGLFMLFAIALHILCFIALFSVIY